MKPGHQRKGQHAVFLDRDLWRQVQEAERNGRNKSAQEWVRDAVRIVLAQQQGPTP